MMKEREAEVERIKSLQKRAYYLIENAHILNLPFPKRKGKWYKLFLPYRCPICEGSLNLEDVTDSCTRMYYFSCTACDYEYAGIGPILMLLF